MTYSDKLKSLMRAWDSAERLVKLAEKIDGTVVLPAINELRYAGRQIADALRCSCDGITVTNPEEFDLCLREGHRFCLRAQHDAIDGIYLFSQKALSSYEREFGFELLLTHFPNFLELRSQLMKADVAMSMSRENRRLRPEIYDDLSGASFEGMLEHWRVLKSNEDVLRSLVLAKIEKENHELAANKAALEKSERSREDDRKRSIAQRGRDFQFSLVLMVISTVFAAILGYYVPKELNKIYSKKELPSQKQEKLLSPKNHSN